MTFLENARESRGRTETRCSSRLIFTGVASGVQRFEPLDCMMDLLGPLLEDR